MKDKSKFQKDLKDEARESARKAWERLDKGRDYLMTVDPKYITVEDCLEAFGFRRDGLGDIE